ncbi:3-oxo-5-alpha-steroid 4-dehydrogenase 1 isoform X2 [Lemur catta]|uniref:3-oxo-5-alpha-steroid 4-dehydrogenase 1 isoform X2 n=1 Tax=Lemur catta TaxID=9447 RepID=UPI001E269153|nr:3-oxo-5-alpha-steroid 4-dehydrogenase 1 isoform X2 [Lemur catta]
MERAVPLRRWRWRWRRSARWTRSPTWSACWPCWASRSSRSWARPTAATPRRAPGPACRRGPPGPCRSCPRWPCRCTSAPARRPSACEARPTASCWPCSSPTTCTGFVLWLIGMLINIHSDHILRNLRKPGETGYKIPRGGLFEYVTAANYFGEIVEWCGYALASWSLQGGAFALFTFCILLPIAQKHHQWYLKNFEDYPKFRKILIPFLL